MSNEEVKLIQMVLKCFVNDHDMLFNDFEMLCVMILKGCVNEFEMDINDLSTSLNKFGSLKKTTKGEGRRPSAAAPLCSFVGSHFFSN